MTAIEGCETAEQEAQDSVRAAISHNGAERRFGDKKVILHSFRARGGVDADALVFRKLVIIGDGACGKTSLLSVFTLGYFPTVRLTNTHHPVYNAILTCLSATYQQSSRIT